MKNNPIIFVIREDVNFRSPIIESLKRYAGAQILMYSSLDEIEEALEHSTPNLLVIDLDFSNKQTKDRIIDLIGFAVPSIILSSIKEKTFAVGLLKRGAIDYVVKEGNYLDVLFSSFSDAISVIELQLKLKLQKHKQIRNAQNILTITATAMAVVSILFVVIKYF